MVFWVNRTRKNVWTTYVDSDWAGEKDYSHTKSQTGVIILLNGLPIFWRSNKQPDTSLSSAQAEVYALAEAARDVSLRFWIAEELMLQVTWPAAILVDNSSGIIFQQSMNPTSKLKGVFNLRLNWVKELQDKRRIRAVKVDTKCNVADILTKPLDAVTRNRLMQIVENTREL